MKKKFSFLICVLPIVTIFTGCGKMSETSTQNSVVEDETVVVAETETETGGQQGEETSKGEKEEIIPWFDSQGLSITPQGEFTYTTMSVDIDNNDVGTFDVYSDVVITESTVGVEDGYKQVTAIFSEDVSDSKESSYWNYISAFDRYTGISFEFDTEAMYTDSGDIVQKEGFLTISNGDESYPVSVSYDAWNDFPYIEDTITVTCPIDYDGTVFQIGYCDPALLEEAMEIDLTAKLYTIDELPFYGEGYYYFSFSNK